MSERERWIVYPLLFLALGASLRDKMFDMTTSRRIVCQELVVAEDDRSGREPVPLVTISAARPSPDGPPVGTLYIEGQMIVNGTINANNYAMRGIPFGPALRAVLPGVSPADLLHALQQSAAAMQQPPQTSADVEPGPAAPAESGTPPSAPPSEDKQPAAE